LTKTTFFDKETIELAFFPHCLYKEQYFCKHYLLGNLIPRGKAGNQDTKIDPTS
jgi:hypothetical protein